MFRNYNSKEHNYFQGEMADHLPWSYFGAEGVVIHKTGVMHRTYGFRGPDLSINPAQLSYTVSNHINKLITELDKDWSFQFEAQRFKSKSYPGGSFSNRTGYLVDKERENKYLEYGEHFESSYYLTLTWDPPSEVESTFADLFFGEGRIALFFNDLFRKKKETKEMYTPGSKKALEFIEQFVRRTGEVEAFLSAYFHIAPMGDDETFSFLNSTISFDWQFYKAPKNRMFLDECLGQDDIDVGNILKIGEYYCPIITVKDFENETNPNMLCALDDAKVEYRWSTRFISFGKEKGSKIIKDYQTTFANGKQYFGQLLAGAFNGGQVSATDTRLNYEAIRKEEEVNDLQSDYAMGTFCIGNYSSNIIVWDKDFEEAKNKSQLIVNIIRSSNLVAKEESLNSLQAFKSMLPGDVDSNSRRLTLTSDNLSNVVPLSAIWSGRRASAHVEEITGDAVPHLVCSTLHGVPFYFNLFVEDVGHMSVIGPTGSGKSTFLNLLANQTSKYDNSRVVFVDVGETALKNTYAMGGQFFAPGIGGFTFQPLRELETEEDVIWGMQYVELLLTIQKVDVTAEKRNTINQAVRMLKDREDLKARTLTTLTSELSTLEEGKEIVAGLTPYLVGGIYGGLLDGEEGDYDIDPFWTMIEVKPLLDKGKEIYTPVLSYLFRRMDKSFEDRRLTVLFLDEFWKLIDNEYFANQVLEWVKTLRKKNVAVVMATQNLSDYKLSRYGELYKNETPTTVFLANPKALDFHDVYMAAGLSESEISILSESLPKRDYLYKSQYGTRLFQLDLNPIMLELIKADNKDEIERIKNEAEELKIPFIDHLLTERDVSFQHLIEES